MELEAGAPDADAKPTDIVEAIEAEVRAAELDTRALDGGEAMAAELETETP